jgi:hypothetical protein
MPVIVEVVKNIKNVMVHKNGMVYLTKYWLFDTIVAQSIETILT